MPPSEARDRRELAVQISLPAALIAVKGQTAPETEDAINRALDLCDTVDAQEERFRAIFAKWVFHAVGGQQALALEAAENLMQRAEHSANEEALLIAHNLLGRSLFLMGRSLEALEHLDHVLAMFERERYGHLLITYGQDPEASCEAYRSLSLWTLGHPEAARAASERAISLALELGHVNTIGFTLMVGGGWPKIWLRDIKGLCEVNEHSTRLNAQHVVPVWNAVGQVFSALADLAVRASAPNVNALREGIDLYENSLQCRGMWHSTMNCYLAEAYLSIGEPTKALAAVTTGLEDMEANEERMYEPELHRVHGIVLAQQDRPAADSDAEASMRKAIELAKLRSAKSFELRATTSLAQLWQSQGKIAEARDLLAPVYGWFTEGFDTPDLQDAKSLLDELS
jgi:predicted ATPase